MGGGEELRQSLTPGEARILYDYILMNGTTHAQGLAGAFNDWFAGGRKDQVDPDGSGAVAR